VICYFVYVASKSGYVSPVVDGLEVKDYSDPIPQAVILTAIVIGFSIQAIMLIAIIKLARDQPFLNTADIEETFSS
jgi:multicomponent Na+:H+ antiporter subunit C